MNNFNYIYFYNAVDYLLKDKVVKSKGELSKEFSISQSKFSEILNKRMKPSLELYSILSEKFKINSTWLLTGEGEMLIGSKKEYDYPKETFDLANEKVAQYQQAEKLPKGAIPFYNLPVSAGRSLFDIEGAMKPDGYFKDIPGISHTEAFLPVHGISMYPEVKEGAIIGVRESNRLDSLNTQHKYLIITREDRMIKYIEHDKEDNEILWCKSSNYSDFKVFKEDIIEVHRITFVMNPE